MYKGLHMVIVEGLRAGAGAGQPRLQESGPGVLQEPRASSVVTANTPDAGVYALQGGM